MSGGIPIYLICLFAIRPKQYQYHSMADMDWGWKKRSVIAPLVGVARSKKHIGSVEQNILSKYHPVRNIVGA